MVIFMNPKYDLLLEILRGIGDTAAAFSGGADSALLLKAASDALGNGVLAVTADSCAMPRSEAAAARAFCEQYGIRQTVLDFDMMQIPAMQTNPRNRCYDCKKALFTQILSLAAENGFSRVIEGTNADDPAEDRPGMRALAELHVRSPLREAGLTKAEIRQISREFGLPTADKPSGACLATRVPFGEAVTPEKLRQIEQAEEHLHRLGFLQCRVRLHGGLARIEILPEQFVQIIQPETRQQITEALKQCGFSYISLDLEGYRSGSMNRTINTEG